MSDSRFEAGSARVLERLERLFALGPSPHASRLGLSAAEDEAHRLVSEWMHEAGLAVETDPIGNLVGRLAGTDPALPEVWLGSHLDTVPAGGRFDGALGVVAGLEAIAALTAPPIRGLVLIAFREEEGARFGRSCLGSRALCGTLGPEELDATDPDGVTVREALLGSLGTAEPPGTGWLPSPLPDCFVELHIEQGPVLAAAGASVGVVTAITGVHEYAVAFSGRRGHAGTTPMDARADALVAAATLIERLQAEVAGWDGRAVATVGRLEVEPGAPNVIPERAQLSVDCRAADLADLAELDRLLARLAADAATAQGARAAVELVWDSPPVAMDARLRETLATMVRAAGLPLHELSSGAGHDAAVLAAAGVPVAMLFARSLADGISHSPDEETDRTAIADSVEVLAAALDRLAGER
jgi:hydantoinase/carbamoylase family amidase